MNRTSVILALALTTLFLTISCRRQNVVVQPPQAPLVIEDAAIIETIEDAAITETIEDADPIDTIGDIHTVDVVEAPITVDMLVEPLDAPPIVPYVAVVEPITDAPIAYHADVDTYTQEPLPHDGWAYDIRNRALEHHGLDHNPAAMDPTMQIPGASAARQALEIMDRIFGSN